jgi:hypothetical protein
MFSCWNIFNLFFGTHRVRLIGYIVLRVAVDMEVAPAPVLANVTVQGDIVIVPQGVAM